MNEKHDQEVTEKPTADSRRAYDAPGVAWEEPIDISANLASACDKNDPAGILCNLPPLS